MHSFGYRLNRAFKWRYFLLTAALVFVFIQLGFWQWHKAQARMQMAAVLQTAQVLTMQPTQLSQPDLASKIHNQKVRVTGHYLPEQTFYLDNQIEQGQAGFHVLTAFVVDQTDRVIWVNRGWVPGFVNHAQVPSVTTSHDKQTIEGLAWAIKKTAFQLQAHALKPSENSAESAQLVQQVIDFKVLQQRLPQTVTSLIIKLDPQVMQDGFVRHWQLPAGEVEKNLGYAYQWFGFAVAAVLICGYHLLEKTPTSEVK